MSPSLTQRVKEEDLDDSQEEENNVVQLSSLSTAGNVWTVKAHRHDSTE